MLFHAQYLRFTFCVLYDMLTVWRFRMTLQQTIEIPESRMVRISRKIPIGRCRVVFFPEPSVSSKATPAEPLPMVTRAEREAAKLDPVIQFLDNIPVESDWSWLPEGLTPETLTAKDIRTLRLKDKYGI
jgi:hypothetical protein